MFQGASRSSLMCSEPVGDAVRRDLDSWLGRREGRENAPLYFSVHQGAAMVSSVTTEQSHPGLS